MGNTRVTFETKEAVEEVADQAGWSMAETVRECIQVGLPTVKSRLTTIPPPERWTHDEKLVMNSGIHYLGVPRPVARLTCSFPEP